MLRRRDASSGWARSPVNAVIAGRESNDVAPDPALIELV